MGTEYRATCVRNGVEYDLGKGPWYAFELSEAPKDIFVGAVRNAWADWVGDHSQDAYATEFGTELYEFCVANEWDVEMRNDALDYLDEEERDDLSAPEKPWPKEVGTRYRSGGP